MNMRVAVLIYNLKFSVLEVLLPTRFAKISANSSIAILYMGTA